MGGREGTRTGPRPCQICKAVFYSQGLFQTCGVFSSSSSSFLSVFYVQTVGFTLLKYLNKFANALHSLNGIFHGSSGPARPGPVRDVSFGNKCGKYLCTEIDIL